MSKLVMPKIPLVSQVFSAPTADATAICPLVDETLDPLPLEGRRVLLIVPDGTRTAPVGTLFRLVHAALAPRVAALDVMIALGTHPPMDEAAINARLEITPEERHGMYRDVRMLNHAWDNPAELATVGTLKAEQISDITDGLFAMDVPVTINRHIFEYDLLLIAGPVFPHEVVGFSGGTKYLFPGIAGPEILNFFHWLAAVITNPRIIGNKWTPVRRVLEQAAAMVEVPTRCLAMVVEGNGLAGLYGGATTEAWSAAADLSAARHVRYLERPFHTVLSQAPPMYDDLWTGGKCMYKLEPVVADGGELIIYAPHISEISVTHGRVIEAIGYHTRDYFLHQWDRFKDYPWGVLAHSTHVRGIGTMEGGIEKPRVQVTLASQVPAELCRRINLGYRDPASINPADFAGREAEGVLYVPKAGELLYRLSDNPTWAQP